MTSVLPHSRTTTQPHGHTTTRSHDHTTPHLTSPQPTHNPTSTQPHNLTTPWPCAHNNQPHNHTITQSHNHTTTQAHSAAISAGSRGKGRGELPPSRIRQDQPEARSAGLLRHLCRPARCCSLRRPRYPRRCKTGSFSAGAGALSPAFWAAWPVQMHMSAWQ